MAENQADLIKKKQMACDMRVQGMGYREIAAALGVSLGTAYNYVQDSLEDISRLTKENAERIKCIELHRLDIAMKLVTDQIKAGDMKAVDALVKLQERRSKYLGLDAAAKMEVEGTGIVINFTPAKTDKHE